ncbi:MAG TPA: HAD-IC family P-type ATPase, partial [Candidatus Merdenecus merdavium]|nr:HAD-IC family P-type ATPase [Candidatus Merdenecus merdavium]
MPYRKQTKDQPKNKKKRVIIPAGVVGLNEDQVVHRINEGLVNIQKEEITRTTKNIIFKNVVTLFNVIIFVLAFVVMLTGEFKNAIFFWVVLVNSSIGIFQEIKAKKTLDKLTVLAKTRVTVLRDEGLYSIAQEEIVLDDVLYLTSGDQVPTDGLILKGTGLEVDESLLTGESDHVEKKDQDQVMSGSFITAGEGFIKVTGMGDDSYSAKLAMEAKAEKGNPSELMNS